MEADQFYPYHEVFMKYLVPVIISILLPFHSFPEGTKQLIPDSTYYTAVSIQPGTTNCFAMESCDPEHKLYVHIDHPGEKIYMGFGSNIYYPSFSLKIKLNGTLMYGPVTITTTSDGYIKYFSQAYAGPKLLNAAGYSPVSYAPPGAGDYEIDFIQAFDLIKMDVVVIDTTISPLAATAGRLWAKKWIFRSSSIATPTNAFLGTMHVYTEDSVVTSIFFNKMQGDYFEVSCNANGCFPPPMKWDSSCRSTMGEHVYPQYKIFVNNPDSVSYPTGIMGSINGNNISVIPGCDGSFTIHFFVGKPGNIKAIFDINPAPGVQPEDVVIMNPVLAGWNILVWNGLNGLGQPVPAGTQVGMLLTFVNGLTNLPIYDVEKQVHGFVITQVRPSSPSIATYWNDTLLANKGGRLQLAGCYGYDTIGCHRWNGYYFGSGIGSMNTVNTWWYAASSNISPVMLTVQRVPPSPDDISGPANFCQSAVNTYNLVPDPLPGADPGNYEWILTEDATGTVLLDQPNQGTSVTIAFSAFPAGNMHLKVRGRNTICGYGSYGPGSAGEGIQLRADPGPQITNAISSFSTCSGNMVTINLQSTVPATTYSYTANATAASVSGYAGGNANPIQQTLFNTGNEVDSVIYHVVPFALSCPGDTMEFYAIVTLGQQVALTISASVNPVCINNPVTFTASPVNSGTSPSYQWKVNGGITGTNSAIFMYTPASGDHVSCMVTSSNTLCIANNPAMSNIITMTVNPALPVSVSIAASSNPFCSGNPVTFTATPINGGAAPAYQWKVNSINAGINNAGFTYSPAGGDQVSCVLTSSELCITGSPATSNLVTMLVNTTLPAGISITASANPFCPGSAVTYTAMPVNGGSNPSYQWKVNAVNAINANNAVFTFSPLPGDDVSCVITSNLNCVTANPATSNIITMATRSNPTVVFNACFDTITTINAKPFKLKGGLPPGGIYSGQGVNSTTGIFTPSAAGPGNHIITYSYTNISSCTSSATTHLRNSSFLIFNCGSLLTDIRDNKIYPTVQIGSQCWMASNLDFGFTIPDFTPQTDNCIAERYLSPVTRHVSRYQWDELMQYQTSEASQGLCPPGWHIPTSDEWNLLISFYNGPGQAGWPLMDMMLGNGFQSLQVGFLYLNNTWAFTTGPYAGSMYWTSTLSGSATPSGSRAVARGLNENNPSVSKYEALRGNAFGVRCVRDF